jgi:hypothetical protein
LEVALEGCEEIERVYRKGAKTIDESKEVRAMFAAQECFTCNRKWCKRVENMQLHVSAKCAPYTCYYSRYKWALPFLKS